MPTIQWFPGHMAKARREISENLNKVDLVIELRDARIPASSMNPMMDEIVKNKPRLILLNKSNLADKRITAEWIKYLNNDRTLAIAVDSIDGYNLKSIVPSAKKLLTEKIERNKARGIVITRIRAMVLGIPNVGKSTFINKITKRKAAKTGDKPGVTKAQKWVKINDEFLLLDTPGILWPKFEDQKVGVNLAICGSIKDDIINLGYIASEAVNYIAKNYPTALDKRYKIGDVSDLTSDEIFDKIAIKRGALQKGGETDYDRIYTMIMNDIRASKLGAMTFERPEN